MTLHNKRRSVLKCSDLYVDSFFMNGKRNWLLVFFKTGKVSGDCILDVFQGRLSCASLRYASWEFRNFGYEYPVLVLFYEYSKLHLCAIFLASVIKVCGNSTGRMCARIRPDSNPREFGDGKGKVRAHGLGSDCPCLNCSWGAKVLYDRQDCLPASGARM